MVLPLIAGFAQALTQEPVNDPSYVLLRVWNWQPPLLSAMLLVALLYSTGVVVAWRRAGTGAVVGAGRVLAFALGLVAVFVAFISPVDALSGVLFSGHMIQHLLLIVVAAPLLVVGAPLLPLLWSLPRRARLAVASSWRRASLLRLVVHWLTSPLVAWVLYGLSLWLWHAPGLYRLALRNEFVHEIMHLSFLLPALLFWWVLLQPVGRPRLEPGAGLLYLFTTMLHSMALAVLITLSPEPLYYLDSPGLWGLSPLEDQQLGGLLMWVPPNFVYIAALVVLLIRLMGRVDERGPPRRERFDPAR